MTRDELERALREAELPDEVAARERARRTVLAAHTRGRPAPARAGVAAVATRSRRPAALVAAQLSPAQASSASGATSCRATPRAAPTPARPALELPARGRLLVTEGDALYVVERSGKRRRLGAWQDATWSPKGLFVGVSRGHRSPRSSPTRDVRWRLRRPAPVSFPRWAPDGTHVAYRSGGNLRIVYGNGTHDVARRPRHGRRSPPPGGRATGTRSRGRPRDGSVTVEDADTAKVLWSLGPGLVTRLAWSADGRELLDRRAALVHGPRRRHAASGPDAAARAGPRSWARRSRRAGPGSPSRSSTAARPSVSIDGAVALTAPGAVARSRVVARRAVAARGLAGRRSLARRAARAAARRGLSAVRHRLRWGAAVRGWCC